MRNRSESRIVRGALFCSALLVVVGLSACAQLAPVKAPVVPPPGLIFTQYKAPLDFGHSKDGEGTPVTGLKSGTSEAHYFQLWYRALSFGWGDVSIEESSKRGGIKEVEYADYQVLSILGLYVNTKITAHGK